MTHHIDLDTLTLESGGHEDRDDGVCLMEAVAWWAEEKHTDHPRCVSPVLGAYGRRLNDLLPAERRQELRYLIPLLPGTAGDGLDERRRWMAVDWAVRTVTPAWLDAAGLPVIAATLRGLDHITSREAARTARTLCQEARQAAITLRNASYQKLSDAAAAAAAAATYAYAAADAAAAYAYAAAAAAAAADAAAAYAYAAAAAAAAGRRIYDQVKAAVLERLAPTIAQVQDSAISLFRAMVAPPSEAEGERQAAAPGAAL